MSEPQSGYELHVEMDSFASQKLQDELIPQPWTHFEFNWMAVAGVLIGAFSYLGPAFLLLPIMGLLMSLCGLLMIKLALRRGKLWVWLGVLLNGGILLFLGIQYGLSLL